MIYTYITYLIIYIYINIYSSENKVNARIGKTPHNNIPGQNYISYFESVIIQGDSGFHTP